MRPFALLLLLAGCQDHKVGSYNTPPAASLLSPADGASVEAGALVEFVGLVDDQQDAAPALLVQLQSSLDGVLGEPHADAEGNVFYATNALTEGDHVITLTVTDSDAESASSAIALAVGADPTPEGAPTVVLVAPAEGDAFLSSDVVNVIATVTDGEDAYDTIACELLDVPDGAVWTGVPASSGSLSVPLTFSVGVHTLTLTAVDADGLTTTASVGFEVIDDGRPRVTIDTPADGTAVDTTDLVSFRGTVSDDVTDVELLAVTWSSDLDGVLSTNPADSSGATSVGLALSAGIHTITLTALDEEGKSGSDAIVLTVTDPDDRDDDGDGWTENGGDCDDADPRTAPDAGETCDDADNDCDGDVNEDWWDGYEPTSSTAPYDCGEVDSSFGWSNSTLSIAGLTLSDAGDEDWFTWDADDEYLDNVSITARATGFPSGGTYVLELYDGDGNLKGSDSGSGSLTVSHEGDLFDDGEDTWSLRVYALSWPSGSCAADYDVSVHS